MGRVVEGADADLVVLDANPIASVQNMHRIAGVEH
jgi:imidazolonepropionase-like amidohydrolase